MLLAVLLSLIAVPLLAVSADQLVLGAARLAERIGISSLVVGVVVIGLGTSAPELLVAGTAASSGHGSLTVGDLTGSNIVNLTFVLGVAGLVAPLKVRSSVVRREAPLAFGAVVVFAVLLLRGLDPVAGVISTILLCGALVLVIRTSRSERADPVSAETEDYLGDPARHGLIWEAARTLLGVVGTLAGARLLVVNAASIAVWLGARQEASAAHRAGLRKPPVPAAHGPGRRCGYSHRGRARNSPAG